MNNIFGMFIHWGIYALSGIQDQVFARFNLPREEYEGFARKFNPVKKGSICGCFLFLLQAKKVSHRNR